MDCKSDCSLAVCLITGCRLLNLSRGRVGTVACRLPPLPSLITMTLYVSAKHTHMSPGCWPGQGWHSSGLITLRLSLCLLRPPHSTISWSAHSHLSDLFLPFFSPVSHAAASGPQWGAVSSLPFPAVTVVFCHPSTGMSFPLSHEDRPSWGDRPSPSAPRRLSSQALGSCPPHFLGCGQ